MIDIFFIAVLIFQGLVVVSQLTIALLIPLYKMQVSLLLLSFGFIFQHIIGKLLYVALPSHLFNMWCFITVAALSCYASFLLLKKLNLTLVERTVPISVKYGLLISGTLLIMLPLLSIEILLINSAIMLVFLTCWIIGGAHIILNAAAAGKIAGSDRRLVHISILALGVIALSPLSVYIANSHQLLSLLLNLGLCGIFLANFINTYRISNVEYRRIINRQKNDHELKLLELKLSAMEYRIAVLMIKGMTFKEVAHALQIDVSTSRWHAAKIYRKLNCEGKLMEFRRRFSHLKVVIDDQDFQTVVS